MRKVLTIVLLLAAVSLGAEKIKLAFIGLEASGVSESTAAGISDAILDTLVNTHRFDVVERAQLSAILEEQALTLSGCMTTECIVEVGQLVGADKALVGKVSQVGRVYTLTVRMADVITGKLEYSDSAESELQEDLLLEGRSIAQRLARSIPVMGTVIGVDKDKIKVNLGTQENLHLGDELEVYRIGEEYYDPDTGLIVGHDIIELGSASVSRVIEAAVSEASLVGNYGVVVGDRVRLKPELALGPLQLHLGFGYPFFADLTVALRIHDNGYMGLSLATVYMSDSLGLDPEDYAAQTWDWLVTLDYDYYIRLARTLRANLGLGGGIFMRSDGLQYLAKVKVGLEYLFSSAWGISAGVDYYPVVSETYFGRALNVRLGAELYL